MYIIFSFVICNLKSFLFCIRLFNLRLPALYMKRNIIGITYFRMLH